MMFVVAGGVAAAVNFASRFVYSLWTPFSTAVILAYLTGMVIAYILVRTFVFRKTTQPVHRSVLYFTVVNLLAILQTWVISVGLADYFLPAIGISDHVESIAHAIGIAVPAVTSYLGHKRWSFA